MGFVTLPPCPNFKAGSCPQSEVFVMRETDDAYILACKGCRSVNVWPKDKAERRGRYEAFLSKEAQKQSEEKIRGLAPLYSIPSLNPGVKTR